MRLRLLSILLLSASIGVHAAGNGRPQYHSRGSAFEIGVGAGYGALGYQAREWGDWSSTVSGRPSGYLHVAYDCFFSEYVGLSVGVDFARYGSACRIRGLQVWEKVVDTDDFTGLGRGEIYDHTLTVNDWREIQSVSYLEVPLSVKFSIPAGAVYVIGDLGAKMGLPVLRSYQGSGSLTHTGYYEPWQLTLHDIDGHGFYTETGYRPKGTFADKTLKWSIFAKIGVAIPLAEHLDLTVQAFGQYAFTGAEVGGPLVPGFRDDREGFAEAHYFMGSYTSLLSSPFVQGKAKPWNLGLEVGIRYTIPHPEKAAPCRCLQQQFVPYYSFDNF